MNRDVRLLIICLLIGVIACMILFGWDLFFRPFVDIQLHDTYFVFNPFELVAASVGFVSTFVFFIARDQYPVEGAFADIVSRVRSYCNNYFCF